ncbi:hypothetical protein quinque_003171 [Culex quinquefasciatus]|uniref:uncharacterized protein LOC119769243 n=1 Tax=Culex quinquefasciatus TaxID=7176 RepID=UPI0018E2CEE9|nr:uncharacterized protein LOC119769243 [Culex quinquefasciatus]
MCPKNRYLLAVALLLLCSGVVLGLSPVTAPALSTFVGAKPPAGTLCYLTTVRKGTSSPVTITNPTPPTVVAYVQTAADRFSKVSYRMLLVNGVLPAAPASIPIILTTLGGKSVFPYNIVVEYWCA